MSCRSNNVKLETSETIKKNIKTLNMSTLDTAYFNYIVTEILVDLCRPFFPTKTISIFQPQSKPASLEAWL